MPGRAARVLEHSLRWLGVALYTLGLARVVIWLTRRIPRVALYHACEPAETDYTRGLGANTPPSVMAAHVAYYRRYYNIVSVADLAGDAALPNAALAITFDDGYRSVYDHAWPILQAHGLAATVYVIGEVVEPGHIVWINELNWWLRRYETLARAIVERHLHARAGELVTVLLDRARATCDRARVAAMLGEIRTAGGCAAAEECRRAPLYLSRAHLAAMALGGARFGGHTVTHPSLPQLSDEECCAEVAGSRSALRTLPGAIDSFAHPFGDVDARTRHVAANAGFASIMEVGGINWPLNLARVARTPVSAHTPAMLFAELEVVAPIRGVTKRLAGR